MAESSAPCRIAPDINRRRKSCSSPSPGRTTCDAGRRAPADPGPDSSLIRCSSASTSATVRDGVTAGSGSDRKVCQPTPVRRCLQLAGQVGDQDLDVAGSARPSERLSASRLANRDRVAATAADVSTSALSSMLDIVQLPTDMSHRRRYPDSVTAVVGSVIGSGVPRGPARRTTSFGCCAAAAATPPSGASPTARLAGSDHTWRSGDVRITARPRRRDRVRGVGGGAHGCSTCAAMLGAEDDVSDFHPATSEYGRMVRQSALAGDQDPAGPRAARGILP